MKTLKITLSGLFLLSMISLTSKPAVEDTTDVIKQSNTEVSYYTGGGVDETVDRNGRKGGNQ